MTSDRSLEARIRAIEDRLEIYNVIASHPPSADTGGSEHIAASWVEDGVFDRGEPATRGRAAIAGQVLSPAHQAAIAGGLAHFTGLPHVTISGDTAVATFDCRSSFRRRRAIRSRCPTTAAPRAFASTA